MRESGDLQALTLPPVASGDVREWTTRFPPGLALNARIKSQPIVGIDSEIPAAGDGHYGLGIQTPLLTPSHWLIVTLDLQPSTHYVLDDDDGPALALVIWRTEYETSEYHLAWPRLCGAEIALRSDVFERLIGATQGNLVLRDFLVGDVNLCA